MTVRRVARFRKFRDKTGQPTGAQAFLLKLALRLLDLLAISIAVVLLAAPYVYARRKADESIDAWSQPRMNDVARVEADWWSLPVPPDFVTGDEPAVRAFLRAQPLVAALQDRTGARAVWVRQGGRLVPGGDPALRQVLGPWFAQAETARRFIWFPTGAMPGETREGPKLILRGDRWQVLKWWREGSPEVEEALRLLLKGAKPFRIALVKDGDEARKDHVAQPWGAEPNLQADPYRAMASIFSTQMVSNEFPGWTFTVIPFQAEAKRIQRGWRLAFAGAASVALAMGGAMVGALWLRSRARRKAALDADRMASMTHSLKTPLAILKFRCDTLRLGRLEPDQLDAQLIQIGEEADRLSDIIENALMAIQGAKDAGPQGEVTPAWIQSIAEDLAPAFEVVNRKLVVSCVEHHGLAALPSLRAALFTLVENALFHGNGTVTLETLRKGKRFLIRVSDEGDGLDSLDLKALGRPFMRIREQGKEGFRQDGTGLGLSLLTKVVEREGWGLTFASEPGRGLTATLEIQPA